MLCPRCGKPVPAGAAFCPACGNPTTPTSLRPPSPAPRPPASARPAATNPLPSSARPSGGASAVAADFDAQKKRNRLAIAGIAVAALLAAFFGAKAFGLLRLGASSPKPGLQVRGEGPNSALQLPGDVPQNSLKLPGKVDPSRVQQGAERKEMPADVRAWLEHLRECERRKVALSKSQIQGLVFSGIADGPTGGKSVEELTDPESTLAPSTKTKATDTRPAWTELSDFFNSKQPPAECMPIASDYNRALGETGAMMGDISNIFAQVQSDPQGAFGKLCDMLGTSQKQIDVYFGSADDKYRAICAKYETAPWFSIRENVGNPSMLSMFSTAGLGCGN